MNHVKNKLESNRGSSIIIALGLFMICAMISSVVVVAAASGSSRNVERIERQRAYLSVSSATQILMDELSDIKEKKYIGRQERRLYICNDYKKVNADGNVITETNNYGGVSIEGYPIDENELSVTGASEAIMRDEPHPNGTTFTSMTYVDDDVLADTAEGLNLKDNLEFLVLKASEDIFIYGREKFEKEFTIQVEGADERFSTVNCKFIMNDDYDITIEITLKDSEYAYAMTIDMEAAINVVPEEGYTIVDEPSEACEHKVCYKIEESGGFISYIDEYEFLTHCEIEFKQTTVTWSAPVLSKGVITAS